MDLGVYDLCGQSAEVPMRRLSDWQTRECCLYGKGNSCLNQPCSPWSSCVINHWCYFLMSCVFSVYIFFLSNLIFRSDNAEMLALVIFSRKGPNTRYPFLFWIKNKVMLGRKISQVLNKKSLCSFWKMVPC